MSTTQKILLFIVLPFLAVISYPPAQLVNGISLILIALVLFVLLGFLLLRGRSAILTLMIFLMGLNAIIRLMMWLPNFTRNNSFDPVYLVANWLGLGLSIWLLLRLDRSDVRVQMIR